MTSGSAPRGHAWLVRHVTQPPASARSGRYFALIASAREDWEAALDLDFLEHGGGDRSRNQTSLMGRLAFCYRMRRDSRLLEKLRRAYVAAARSVTPRGMFEWRGDTGFYFRPHEQAWRLEALLLGYIWVGAEFPPADRQAIEPALERAARWLAYNPTDETNNRGAVWCAVATLAGLYYDRPEYLAQVDRYAPRIIGGAVWEDGEVGEHAAHYGGGGPDSNYSYTGWSYVYLYRLLSGKDELDPRLLKALQWFSLYNTLSGSPVVDGASVRKRRAQPGLADLLPALEHYGAAEPFFAAFAGTIVAKLERAPDIGGHTVSPLFWAMWEPGPAASSSAEPGWRRNQTRIYERDAVHYALVSRHYQTGVVFRGLFPLRGMQTFAFGAEEPILLNTGDASSGVVADGIDTAAVNASEVLPAGSPAVIAERRGSLWTVYAYTPDSAVVVSGGAHGPLRSRWIMHRTPGSAPVLDASRRTVAFAGRQGRVSYLSGRARLTDDVLEVVADPPMAACAFSNGSFRWRECNAEVLSYADSSGAHRLRPADWIY